MMSAIMLRATFGAIRRKPFAIIVPVVVDFIALIVFASLYSSLFVAATSQITGINDILGAETAAFVASGGAITADDPALAEQEAELSQLMATLVLNIVLICLLAYVIFTLSQTVSWWMAHRAAGAGHASNMRHSGHVQRDGHVHSRHASSGALSVFGRVLLRMLWLNALWFILVLVVLGGSGYLMGQAGSSPVPIVGPGFYVTLAVVALVVLVYFMTVSYAFILHAKPLRTSLRQAFSHAARYGVPFGIVLLGFIGFTFIIPPIGAWHYVAGILCFLLLIAWLAVGRMWFAALAAMDTEMQKTAEVRT